MVAPHELRKKEFTRTMRGYNTQEVDAFVSDLIKNYAELYRRCAETEKRLQAVAAQNEELSKDTHAVRAALLDAQRAAEKIVGDAREEARMIISSAKRSCDSILNEFHVLVEKERTKLVVTQNAVSDFKAKLYEEYQAHIDRIGEITEEAEMPDIDDDELVERIITDIKADAARWAMSHAEDGENVPKSDAPEPELFDAANKAEEEGIAAQSEEPAANEAEPISEIEGLPLDAEIIGAETIDPPVEDDSATRTFDAVTDGDLPVIETVDPEPEPEPETEPEPEPELQPETETESEDYDDELARFAAELEREKGEKDN